MTANVSIFSLKLILSMIEEVSFMRFGKHATPQKKGEHVCVYNPVIQGRIFPFPFVICIHAGGTWGMKRSGANEDTSSLPVISALDAELTYLRKCLQQF